MPASTIPGSQTLQAAVVDALRRWGARVRIDPCGENLVRRLGPRPSAAERGHVGQPPPASHRGPPVGEIEVQGLPNLLHEFVHVVQAGVIDDDHGIDYQAIPYRLDDAVGRAVWWDELAACVVSCAYLEDTDGQRARAAWWFDEQLGIQPVFYGYEDDPAAFWRRVPALVRTHRAPWEAHRDRAYHACAVALPGVAGPPRLDFETFWPGSRWSKPRE